MQGLKQTCHPPPFFSKTRSRVLRSGGRVGWGVEAEGKSLNWSSHQRLSSWDFRGKKARTDRDAIPKMRFRCRVHGWGGKARPASPLPSGRTHGCSHCNGCSRSLRQPGPGTLVESHPEHQMAHQRAESNFSHGIASGSSACCQFKVVSLPNWLLLSPREFFLNFFFNHSDLDARHHLQNWLERHRSSFHQVPWIWIFIFICLRMTEECTQGGSGSRGYPQE